MDLQLHNRVAVVTGASSGLGRAVALELAREGATVAVSARRRDALEQLAGEARVAGARDAAAFVADQSEAGAMERLVRDVTERFGAPSVVVANGGGPKPGTFTSVSLEDWDAGYAGTLRSMLELVSAAVPAMRAQRWGRVVALTSMSVKQPIPQLVMSNSYRSALTAALKTLSIEVAAEGVTVNTIATGRFLTDRLRELYDSDEALHTSARLDVPMGRVGTVEEFSPLVAFLCGEGARYITGQTIAVDGGYIKSLF